MTMSKPNLFFYQGQAVLYVVRSDDVNDLIFLSIPYKFDKIIQTTFSLTSLATGSQILNRIGLKHQPTQKIKRFNLVV